jgi:hypothetical protein
MLLKKINKLNRALLILLMGLWACPNVLAQDLEPRRWSHLPTGLSFIGIGYGFSSGDIFLDPLLLAEDVEFKLNNLAVSYVHSFEWFGKSARIDVLVPYASGRWEGIVDGVDTSLRRRGFMDPRFRLTLNLYGAPALTGKAYAEYRAANPVATTIGLSFTVIPPLGEYYKEKLINLGKNRWRLRTQMGVLHRRGPWEFELTGSVSVFSDNNEFYMNTKREQDPLFFSQAHAIYTFRPGLWLSASTGFAWGGENYVNGNAKNDAYRKGYWALSLGLPINRQQGVKLVWIAGRTNTDRGYDADTALLAWSYMWGN